MEEGNRIRVRWSGLLLFTGENFSLLLGLLFSVVIARLLDKAELGAWFLLGGLIVYFEIFEKAIPYWGKRDFARGFNIAKTSIISALLISVIPTCVYLTFAYLTADALAIPKDGLFLGAALIPTYYVRTAAESNVSARYPHKLSLRPVFFDLAKLLLILYLYIYGFVGVVATVIMANLLYVAYCLKILRRDFETGFNKRWLVKRLKQSWIPLQRSIITNIRKASDLVIVGVMSGVSQLASYGIALIFYNLMKSSKSLLNALYPHMLSKRGRINERELSSAIKFYYIFAIPMLVGIMLLADNFVELIFGSRYLKGVPSLLVLMPGAFLATMSLILDNIVRGAENVDESLDVSFRRLAKSGLWFVELRRYFSLAVFLIATLALVPVMGILGAAVVRAATNILSFVFSLAIYLRYFSAKPLLTGIPYTAAATIPMALFIILFNPVGFLLTGTAVVLGVLIYFAVLLVIDKETRMLSRVVYRELRIKLLNR